MFNLEFFKCKIDTTTIQNQTPPIDPEVVDSINGAIKEENDNESGDETLNFSKFHETQILHDRTAYKGQWRNFKRHGKGTLFELCIDNTLQKIYEGEWEDDEKHGKGTLYDGTDSLEVSELIDDIPILLNELDREQLDL